MSNDFVSPWMSNDLAISVAEHVSRLRMQGCVVDQLNMQITLHLLSFQK